MLLVPRRRTALLASLAAVVVLGTTACGDSSDDTTGGSSNVAEVTIPPSAAVSPSASSTEAKTYVFAQQDGECPAKYPVKVVNLPGEGTIYLTPETVDYRSIRAGFCFLSAEAAQAKGFSEHQR